MKDLRKAKRTMLSVLSLGALAVVFGSIKLPNKLINADAKSYKVVFDSTNGLTSDNIIDDCADLTVTSSEGNDLEFFAWFVEELDGEFGSFPYDDRDGGAWFGNTTKLSGITSIKINIADSYDYSGIGAAWFDVYWGWDEDMSSWSEKATDEFHGTFKFPMSAQFDFNGEKPSYFYFENWQETPISSIEVCYSCEETEDPYAKEETFEDYFEFVYHNEGAGYQEGYYLKSYQGEKFSEITIPATYNELPVVGIDNGAFSYNDSVEKVIISEGIKDIKQNVFLYCDNLESISIPSTVENIGAQSGGSSIAFNCNKLSEIIVDENNPYYNDNNGNNVIIETAKNKLMTYCINSVLPSDLKILGQHSISNGCPADFVIPDGVTTIENAVFDEAHNLKRIFIPDSVSTVAANIFYGSKTNLLIYVEREEPTEGNPLPSTWHSEWAVGPEGYTYTVIYGASGIPQD